jgi:hypothetical protein
MAMVALLSLLVAPPLSARQSLDQRLQMRFEQLLLSYRDFKGYPDKTAADVDLRLSDDRRQVLVAIIRASFMPLTPRNNSVGIPAGARFVDYITAVHGIWGVRPTDSEGRNQFRLSVQLRPETRRHLEGAREFGGGFGGIGCHVLQAEKTGGDDMPSFNGFRRAPDPRCRRSVDGTYPRMQVSYRDSDSTVGEIDLDFDAGECHTQPSNSDGRHVEDRHFDLLNQAYSYFMAPFTPKCQLARFHCADR